MGKPMGGGAYKKQVTWALAYLLSRHFSTRLTVLLCVLCSFLRGDDAGGCGGGGGGGSGGGFLRCL